MAFRAYCPGGQLVDTGPLWAESGGFCLDTEQSAELRKLRRSIFPGRIMQKYRLEEKRPGLAGVLATVYAIALGPPAFLTLPDSGIPVCVSTPGVTLFFLPAGNSFLGGIGG